MKTVYLWPDQEIIWCTSAELDVYLSWMSDDFIAVLLTTDDYEDLLAGNENILLPYRR
jgi:hypothetical protein